MKMSDVFKLPAFYEHDPLSETAKFSGWHGSESICKSLFLAFDDGDADAICIAINNHDRMADEIAELRDALERSNFAFQANLARVSVKCEQSMLEALERNKKLLNK